MLPSPESFSRSATSEQRTSSEYSWHKDRLTPCVFWTVCSLDSYKPDENQERLMSKLNIVINGFAGCGLVCSQTSDDDLRVILDNFLNGGVRTDFGTVVLK